MRYITLATKVATHLETQDEAIDLSFETESETGSDYGYCDGNTEFADITIYRKVFGEKAEVEEICRTIIHELVHAKQFLEGRLTLEGGARTWLGESYDGDINSAPWELEASKLEDELYPIFEQAN